MLRCFFGQHSSTSGVVSVTHGWNRYTGPMTWATFKCDHCGHSFTREDQGHLPRSFYAPPGP